ncbi:MAG: hypothetical protein RLZZ126_814 [Pseudomonadota bacterium]|jgi:diguanylate cyclase
MPPASPAEALAPLDRALADLRDCQTRLASAERQVQEAHAQMEEMAALLFEQGASDALTGLKNRTAFDRIMRQQASRSARAHVPLSLVMVDVDGLGGINASLGRVGGDHVLQQVATVLKAQARAYDYVVRYESDCFCVVLPDTGADGALVVAERARAQLAAVRWRHRPVTVSMGVVTAHTVEGLATVERDGLELLQRAKASGGDQLAR